MINVDRTKVFVGIPTYDRRLEVEDMTGLMRCQPYYGRTYFNVGMSNICLARNEIAHIFVETAPEYDWLMMIDSDTIFTESDWELLWQGDEDLVCAEYSRKILGEPPVQFGLGFTRVHRRVFEKIKNITNEDGSEYAQRFYHKSAMMVNYFPNGANPAGRWIGEDHGFFMLAAMTDILPRVETRTKLRHVGDFEFEYPYQISTDKLLHYFSRNPKQLEELQQRLDDLAGAQ